VILRSYGKSVAGPHVYKFQCSW